MVSDLEIGKRLKAALGENHLTAGQLADRMGYSRSQMYKYCSGNSSPSLGLLAEIARSLRRPLDYFISDDRPSGTLMQLLAEAECMPEECQDRIGALVRAMLDYERQRIA